MIVINTNRNINECIQYLGEYICAASIRQYRLYIWEIFPRLLVQIFGHVRGKSISDIIWHPYRPIVISISNGMSKVIKIRLDYFK
jgi:hypothetical protein